METLTSDDASDFMPASIKTAIAESSAQYAKSQQSEPWRDTKEERLEFARLFCSESPTRQELRKAMYHKHHEYSDFHLPNFPRTPETESLKDSDCIGAQHRHAHNLARQSVQSENWLGWVEEGTDEEYRDFMLEKFQKARKLYEDSPDSKQFEQALEPCAILIDGVLDIRLKARKDSAIALYWLLSTLIVSLLLIAQQCQDSQDSLNNDEVEYPPPDVEPTVVLLTVAAILSPRAPQFHPLAALR